MEMIRNQKLDFLKFLLIASVVFAHIPLLEGIMNNGLEPLEVDRSMNLAMKIVYAFHMPLFVFLSGYFTKKRSFKDTIHKSLPLLQSLFVFQIIDIAIICINAHSLPTIQRVITPCFALWYLLALFYWRVMVSLINDDGREKVMFIATVFISLLIGFIPIQSQLGFQRTFAFLPFFYGGYLMKKFNKNILQTPFWMKWGG